MSPYLFTGVVYPERAHVTLQFNLSFSHYSSGIEAAARVNVLLNQLAVWVDSEHEWDVLDLRNVVKFLVQNQLDMLGYLKGLAYDAQITRVLNPDRGIDYVFGIDIPCLAERGQAIDLQQGMLRLMQKASGPTALFLHRCFSDLASSMRHPDDTAFYCYRAIESLRHHCATREGLTGAPKARQWEKFRELAGCTEGQIGEIKTAADPLRHGEAAKVTSADRARLFLETWTIVDAYLEKV
jgi:hypothetical protein